MSCGSVAAMKIVVTTATGHVGSRVTQLLVQSGVRPTLLLRSASRLDAELRDLVDTVEGDQGDVDYVIAATQGADALYWVSPPPEEDDPLAAYARFAAVVARAVTENRIPRTVVQSSIGAEKRHGAGEIDGLAAAEVALDRATAESGGSVIHLRPGYYFTNLLMDIETLRLGAITTTVLLDLPMPWVDPRDVGDIAAARLLSTDWSGQIVQAVHGPEDLTYLQLAERLSHALDRDIRAQLISDDDVREALRGAGMSDKQVEAIVGMSVGVRENFQPEDARTILTTTPTGLTGWAREHLLPLL